MIKKPKIWLITSMVTMITCVAVIAIIRPTWGIDFTGGSLIEFSSKETSPEKIRDLLTEKLETSVGVQKGEGNRMIIKTVPMDEETHQRMKGVLEEENILEEELRFESIGPTIGEELRRKAVTAIAIVVIVLIIYLAYTFRQASGLIDAWKFGIAAIYALLHDLLVVMTLFVILGKLMGVTVDTLFVTAALAILGYSVNDTIVIFHRLKSEWVADKKASLVESLERAVRGSLIRSLNTSLTTLLVLGALLILGGSSIRWFVAALAMGTVAGTYSSLFVAPPLLYYLAKK
jgi:preprotein translocase subunit SecF